MNFLKKIFKSKEKPIETYTDFWTWFQDNQQDFFKVVQTKNSSKIDEQFLSIAVPKLGELKKGFFISTGMDDDKTAELVLTADGDVRNIAFIEDLVAAAPQIEGWKITALKEPMPIENVNISMNGYEFHHENIWFYSIDSPEYPDEIEIRVVHEDWTKDTASAINTGVMIFLDYYLGEVELATNIDSYDIEGKKEAQKELVPIIKLKDFLRWRQKEFIERYKGTRHDTENDGYSTYEAELKNGNMLLAVMNTTLLNWDRKASHPWLAIMVLKYKGHNGMPNDEDFELLNAIEEEMLLELKDVDGYLNVGRQTADYEREIYFACKDFRKPSKVFYATQQKYEKRFEIEFDIFKDKYWQTFNRFVG
jgi:Family of unknown function (DUF695)